MLDVRENFTGTKMTVNHMVDALRSKDLISVDSYCHKVLCTKPVADIDVYQMRNFERARTAPLVVILIALRNITLDTGLHDYTHTPLCTMP